MDWSNFSVRLKEEEWATAAQVVAAIPKSQVDKMRREVKRVYRQILGSLDKQVDYLFQVLEEKKRKKERNTVTYL